ncbi:hypothetical protein BJ508DRAFT_366955 [Ascobolus immersus RN42]|uniref:Uncharacterized protein n=1 Tax=Ascobolus immersus RN42 TaxID=1160509 RepID=A0A3N4HFM5_ASCIM|nr:hypothetical protein BJ508DRAFT_366955 [Ascobolus immersus RN42]
MQFKLTLLNILTLLAVTDLALVYASPIASPKDGKIRGWFARHFNRSPSPHPNSAQNAQAPLVSVPEPAAAPATVARPHHLHLRKPEAILQQYKDKLDANRSKWRRSPVALARGHKVYPPYESYLDREWAYFKDQFSKTVDHDSNREPNLAEIWEGDIMPRIDKYLYVIDPEWAWGLGGVIVFTLLTQEMFRDYNSGGPGSALTLLYCPAHWPRFVVMPLEYVDDPIRWAAEKTREIAGCDHLTMYE